MLRSRAAPRVTPTCLAGGVALGVLAILAAALSGCPAHRPPARVEFPPIGTVSAAVATDYAGSEACARCHAEVARSHAESHHAHALSLVSAATHGARFRRPSNVLDAEKGLRFTTGVIGLKCVMTVRQGAATELVAANYAFGSGKHAITYHGEYRGELLELRLSYYTKAGRWDFSPGQRRESMSGGVMFPAGLRKAPAAVEGCFVCHATAVVKEGGVLQPLSVRPGVGCETCHGPGRAHIQAAERRDADLGMARLAGARSRVSTELCGQCHRSPAGDSIHDPYNRSQLARFQGLALSQSACFTNSQGRLSCLSCHDPHANDHRTDAQYNSVCASCHGGGAESPCPIQPQDECVDCHMPKQKVGMPTDLAYRNHWIKVWSR